MRRKIISLFLQSITYLILGYLFYWFFIITQF